MWLWGSAAILRGNSIISLQIGVSNWSDGYGERRIGIAQRIREVIGTALADFNCFYRIGYEKGYEDEYRRGRQETEFERLFKHPVGSLRKSRRE